MSACPLCAARGVPAIWADRHCRVINAHDPGYPAFFRVIWHEHVAEMTDLGPGERQQLLRVVFAVETAFRDLLRPVKINLASLGNQVPHLHWHVIARFEDDAHFPDAIWAPARRPGRVQAIDEAALALRIREILATPPG